MQKKPRNLFIGSNIPNEHRTAINKNLLVSTRFNFANRKERTTANKFMRRIFFLSHVVRYVPDERAACVCVFHV